MMTARMPSRINEVDDDLNMTGIPFPLASGAPRVMENPKRL
jgi:hypothetical protein